MDDLRCILCGESGNLHLNVIDGDTFCCRECDGEFTAADVRQQQDLWGRMLAWVDLHPNHAPAAGEKAKRAG